MNEQEYGFTNELKHCLAYLLFIEIPMPSLFTSILLFDLQSKDYNILDYNKITHNHNYNS